MYYRILNPEKKLRRRYMISSSATSVGRFIRQCGPPGRFAVVTLQMEPIPLTRNCEPRVEVFWEVDLNKFPADIAKEIFEGVVNGVKVFADSEYCDSGALTSTLVRILDAEYHQVDSSEFCYMVATSVAIRDCFAQSGITKLRSFPFVIPERFTELFKSRARRDA
jgi:translation elongation factor EF-G